MSNPRVKRQFAGAASDPAQRQITNFYAKSTTAKTTSTTASSPSSSTIAPLSTVAPPPPPAHIQANLLNVGMRVRKSVPDGYKTGTYSSFSLWTDTDGAGRSKSQQASRPTPTRPFVTTAPTTSTKTTIRELQPFCGILKTGGLGVQDLGLDHVPGLCSSQDSLASEDSVSSVPEPALSSSRGPTAGPSGRKRRSDQDDDDADDDEAAADVRPAMLSHHTWSGSREDWLNAEVSPRSPAPAGFENARVLATPRPRKPASLSAVSGAGFGGLSRDSAALATLGQENVGMNDFEDATFLDRRWVLQEGMDTE